MAMTSAGLSAVIKSEIEDKLGAPEDAVKLQKFCDALGTAIVTYIQSDAVVNVNGVTPGSGTASGVVN